MQLDQHIRLDGALRGVIVTTRDGCELGEVSGAIDDRLLLVTGQRKLLGRSRRYAIHRATLADLDLDTMTISLRATRAQVDSAPDFLDGDQHSGLDLERYYATLG